MKASPLKYSLPALLLATVILVPFLNKAFTIDDTVFLFEARHVLTDPLHPTAFEMTWERVPERVSLIVPTGPVMAWLLVPSILAGGAEWMAHAVQLVLLLAAILATVSLALRLGLTPLWAAAAGMILAGTPAVLGMAGTAMPDVPAMALGVTGLERLVAWREDRKTHQGVSAAILLGVAPHARLHLFFLFGVAALLVVGNVFDREAWKGLWRRGLPLFAAVLITAAVAALTRDPGPDAGSVVGTLRKLSSTSALASNTIALAVHWVFAMSFALPWLALRWRSIVKRYWLFIAATVASTILLFLAHRGDAPYALAPVAGLGVTCLADVIMDSFQRRDGLQCALGIWLLLPLLAVIYVHFPPKYLIVSAPAAALLLARTASTGPRPTRYALGLSVLVGLLLGIAILRADAAFAGVSRVAAQKLVAPQIKAGRTVWYLGHWGFQWYAEKAGARCLNAEPPYPLIGDLIAYYANRSNPLNRQYLEEFILLDSFEDRRPGGRVMSKKAGAGFYSNNWGYLPWAWSDDVNDAVELWLVYPRQQESDSPPDVHDER